MSHHHLDRHSAHALTRQPVSAILREFAAAETGDMISLGEIVAFLKDRAFGILMLILAAPNIIPIPTIGISTIFGIPLIFFTIQLAIGAEKPWLPKVLLRQSIPRDKFLLMMQKAADITERIERYIKPRWPIFCSWHAERLWAIWCLVMALSITLPIPFGNFFPGITVSLVALGIIQKDGVAMLGSLVTGIIGIAIVSTVSLAAFEAMVFFVQKAFS